jgi:hypothetical protein
MAKYPSESELIVVAKPEAALRAAAPGTHMESVARTDVTPLNRILKTHAATIRPLFGASEDRLILERLEAAPDGPPIPNLSVYYRVKAPEQQLRAIAKELREHEAVEAAYVKPPAQPPLNEMAPAAVNAPPATPNFTSRQIYLDAAPGGIDARHAWMLRGGRGEGVRIIDIEGAWRFSHEDLTQNQGGVVGGTPSTDIGWRNHGTAVIGEFGGDANGFGITGICPEANVSAISIFGDMGSAPAIRNAANRLQPGHIILLELHRAGPLHNFENRPDQHGFIAIEWWPDDFDAILYATRRGIVVVEAGGNGAQNLDDAIYNTPAPGFPSGWTNPSTGPIAILALFSSVPERPLRERMDAITDRIARDSTSPILAKPSMYRAGDAR